MFVYRLYNENDEIVYIGKTVNGLRQRITQHIGKGYHQDIEWRKNISKYDYMGFKNEADLLIYELYCINRFQPEQNRSDKTGQEPNLTLPLEFSSKMSIDKLDYNPNSQLLKYKKKKGYRMSDREKETLKEAVNNLP